MPSATRGRVPASRSRRLLLGSAVLTAILTSGCGWRIEHPEPSPRPLPAGAFSLLDDRGVAQVRASRSLRLDMRSGTLLKTAVGLSATADAGPEVDTTDTGRFHLLILAPSGRIEARTDRLRLDTVASRPDFREVTYFLTARSFEEYVELIRDGVRRYGIGGGSAERWIRAQETDLGSRSDFSLRSGTSTGLEVNYDLRYDGARSVQVIIVHVLPQA